MKITKGIFKYTGINDIDIDLVTDKWNHLWMLAEWKVDNSWKIVKYIRKDSQNTEIKLTISCEQATELIKNLGLININTGFQSGYSWRTKKDMVYLENWRLARHKKLQTKLITKNF